MLLALLLNNVLAGNLVVVPDVVGQSQASGITEIESAGLSVASLTENSAIVASGNIISQNPAAGSSVLSGSVVVITVSLGASSGGGEGVCLFRRHRRAR